MILTLFQRRRARPGPARLLAAGAAVILFTTACRHDTPVHLGDPALDAELRVSPTPAAVGEARVFVIATDGGVPLEGGRVRVRAVPGDRVGELDQDATDQSPWLEAPSAPGGHGPVTIAVPTPGAWWVAAEITVGETRRAVVRYPLAVVTGR